MSTFLITYLFSIIFTSHSYFLNDQHYLGPHETASAYGATTFCVPYSVCNPPGTASTWYNQLSTAVNRTILVRMYILSANNGSNSVVSNVTAQTQIDYLNRYYQSTRINFRAKFYLIRNSSLLSKYALPNCNFSAVGNGHCDSLCNNSVTNYDGGN